jgi:hypothetical protein
MEKGKRKNSAPLRAGGRDSLLIAGTLVMRTV